MLSGVVDPSGRVLYRSVVSSHGIDREVLLDRIGAEIGAAREACPDAAAVGIGLPCTIDRRAGVCIDSNHLPLVGLALTDVVDAGLPTTFDNDGNVAVLAEHRFGAARGFGEAMMLTLGTGIGGGMVLDGRPYRGARGAGAELGHVVVDYEGPPCQGTCPNRGCVEVYASGTAIASAGRAMADLRPDSQLARARDEGELVEGPLLSRLAAAGDAASGEVLEVAGRRLGTALATLANAFGPGVIVIGGGAMAAGDLILAPARAEFLSRVLPPHTDTPIRAAELGPDAGMIGAATLALDELAAGATL